MLDYKIDMDLPNNAETCVLIYNLVIKKVTY